MSETQKLNITTPFIKLEQSLKLGGLCISGGDAKNAIQSGTVFVNGASCLMRGKKLYSGDTVTYKGSTLEII